MALSVETLEELPRHDQEHLRSLWMGTIEADLVDEHNTYDLHLVARNDANGSPAGWAAIRFAPARMTADVLVAPGRGSLERTALLVDALRVLSEGKMSIEWWTRGTSTPAARRVASLNRLPVNRTIIRMERTADAPTADLKVRSFRADDAAEVVRVNNAAFIEHPDQFDMTEAKLHKELARRHASRADLLLTHVNRRLAGFIWTHPRSATLGELHVLAVDPDLQGQGLGSRLLDAGVEHLYRAYGIGHCFLYVDQRDRHAISIYERHGFRNVHAPLISYLV